MTDRVIIKHEVVPDTGSFEVSFFYGRPSQYFDWDNQPSRRLNPAITDSETALERARRWLGLRILHDSSGPAEHAEQSTITITLGGFARSCSARL